MKVGIMQPYFFPYIGYFQLINQVDKWVVFDDVQFINKGWINRNRIIHPTNDWQYITVPLKSHKRHTLIKDIEINNSLKWRQELKGKLTVYSKRAPYYKEIKELICEAIDINTNSIVELNINIMSKICEYLQIKFDYIISSKADFDYSSIKNKGDWALEISKQINGHEYINPINGKDLFDKNKFTKSNIKLCFLRCNEIKYNQRKKVFQDNLSIIDVLMYNSKEEAIKLLNEFKLER